VQHAFHVDLRGVVDLLSHHLYSSPRVYVRELLQNAVDAITAREQVTGQSPRRIRIEPPEVTGDGTLRIHDTGIGLTEPQVHELLATIGRSSKRDDLGFARHEFLGQFGIGLLSCFLVADDIEVITRSCVEEDADTVVWRGYGDGHYTVEKGDRRAEPGTTVTLRPRRGNEHWLTAETVAELARHYGGLLPYDVRIGDEPVTDDGPPWISTYADLESRHEALLRYGTTLLGYRPFDVVDLAVSEADLTGVAFVLPSEAHPGERASHRVYLKRMLIGDRVEKLMPDWAFFARCVVDTGELRPTASREQLYEDSLLETTREALGRQLRDWLVRLATTSPERLREFLEVHDRGVKALALHDDDMLRLVDQWLSFETSDGDLTLSEFRRRHDRIRYTPTTREFHELTGVASAQGVGLVNGGYEYVSDILRRLPVIDPDVRVERLDPSELATRFDPIEPDVDVHAQAFLAAAEPALDRLGCQPRLRAYDPATIPALYLDSAAARLYTEAQQARHEAEGVWLDVLHATHEVAAPPPAMPTLVLNHRNPLVRRLVTVSDPELIALAVEALYGQALLTGQRPLRPADVAALNGSFLGLLERAVRHPTGQ
jgi:molecular chaperone HtpG